MTKKKDGYEAFKNMVENNRPAVKEESLFEQMATITKAHAYDTVSQQVVELKEVIRELIAFGELEDITFTEPMATATFQNLVKKAKILSL